MIHSYPILYNLSRGEIKNILQEDVVVQEKIDGSHFSFKREGDNVIFRTRFQYLDIDKDGRVRNSDCQHFQLGVNSILAIRNDLPNGVTYRGEFLFDFQHNVLAYASVPNGNIILFDIDKGEQCYLPPSAVEAEAKRLGLDAVRTYYQGRLGNKDINSLIKDWLSRIPILGGAFIEGVVIKAYKKIESDGRVFMGKILSKRYLRKRDAKKSPSPHITTWDAKTPCNCCYKHPLRISWSKDMVGFDCSCGTYTEMPKEVFNALRQEIINDYLEKQKQKCQKRSR